MNIWNYDHIWYSHNVSGTYHMYKQERRHDLDVTQRLPRTVNYKTCFGHYYIATPHQLYWGNWTAISCTKCSQMTGVIHI